MTRNAAELLHIVAPDYTGANAANQAAIIAAIAPDFERVLAEYQISTPLRMAHFLAQIAHESAGLVTTVEFASGKAYEGRKDLGNVNRGDGVRYKGRGLLQLTGRANYQRLGGLLGLDLVGKPDLAAEPLTSLRIACVYWTDRKINPLCDADDLIAVTKKVNGGLNGLEDRHQYLQRAKTAIQHAARVAAAASAADEAPVAPPAMPPAPVPPERGVEMQKAAAESWTLRAALLGFVTWIGKLVEEGHQAVSGAIEGAQKIIGKGAPGEFLLKAAGASTNELFVCIGLAALGIVIARRFASAEEVRK